MEPLRVHTGVVAPLARADVDTDQIIPKQFLKRIERSGYGEFLFWDWSRHPDGSPRPDFVLNRPELSGASILVAGANFGCGSSREHAAWALQDAGFRVVLAPRFADIFRQNADSNGLAALALEDTAVEALLDRAEREAPLRLTVDVAAGEIRDADGVVARFEIDDFRRTCLMEGLDRIALTLRHEPEIVAYEERRRPDAGRAPGPT